MQSYQSVFKALPTLPTPRLLLRPLKTKDREDLFAYAKDDEVSKFVLWDTHQSLLDAHLFIKAARKQYKKGLPSTFAIEDKETGKMVGTIGFMWINTEFKSAEIGYSLSRRFWNKGIMTEALGEILKFSFNTLHLNRVEAQFIKENIPSQRVMEKCNMQYEGLLRERVFIKGQFKDVMLYAILKNDPCAQKYLQKN